VRRPSKKVEFDLGALNIDEPITWIKSKRFQEEFDKKEKGEEVKFIYFSQFLEYDLFLFLIIFLDLFLDL